jgi:hypothetical protein
VQNYFSLEEVQGQSINQLPMTTPGEDLSPTPADKVPHHIRWVYNDFEKNVQPDYDADRKQGRPHHRL